MTSFVCPVCGYPALKEPPRTSGGGASYEICASCGFQFGFDDESEGRTYADWRRQWLTSGMPWSSLGLAKPASWDPRKQLEEFLAHGDTSEDDVDRSV